MAFTETSGLPPIMPYDEPWVVSAKRFIRQLHEDRVRRGIPERGIPVERVVKKFKCDTCGNVAEKRGPAQRYCSDECRPRPKRRVSA